MDTHNNRPFKCKCRTQIVKLRSEKYNAAKVEAAKNPLLKGRVAIPKISREEITQIILINPYMEQKDLLIKELQELA